MLAHLGSSPDAFQAAVAREKTDEEVVSYVTDPAVAGGAAIRAEAIVGNPWLAEHPEITKSLDFLQYREDNGLDDD